MIELVLTSDNEKREEKKSGIASVVQPSTLGPFSFSWLWLLLLLELIGIILSSFFFFLSNLEVF